MYPEGFDAIPVFCFDISTSGFGKAVAPEFFFYEFSLDLS